MSLPEPLFGPSPVIATCNQVEKVCVNFYPHSSTRPYIWEGFQTAHSKIAETKTPGKLWVSGDFVVDHEDPNYAQIHFRVASDAAREEGLLELLSWLNAKEHTDQLSCDLSAFVEPKPGDPGYHLATEFAEILLDSFTSHGDYDKKGFPIIPMP